MDFKKIICKEVEKKEDYYDVVIKTYNQEFSGRFERSELRHLISVLDQGIGSGVTNTVKENKEKT